MESKKWRVNLTTSPLGDTGDYMTSIELTDGKIGLYADSDDMEPEVQEIADTLNTAPALQAEVDRLTKALRALYAHSPDLDDTSMSSDPSFTEAIINAKEILDNLK